MTEVERLAEFAVRASYDELSGEVRDQLKIRVLDSLGCAIGAIDGEPVQIVRRQLSEFDCGGACTLIGGGQVVARSRHVLQRCARPIPRLQRRLPREGRVVSSERQSLGCPGRNGYANGSGRDLLVALAVAYQVQCRLSDEAPVRAAGFDHTTQGAYAVAAGVSRALALDAAAAANAIAISGTAFNALRVTRTGALSHWKGLAYPNTAAGCVRVTFLARRGITGPLEVFEGNKGFIGAIAGPFHIDWSSEDLERVTRTVIKRHNAEIHAQTAIDAALELKRQHRFSAAEVDRIDVETFDVAYKIIGGGEEGDKSIVCTKEDADHSLPYLIAVALLDNEVLPAQFAPDRIQRADVQQLLCRVSVRATPEYSQAVSRRDACPRRGHPQRRAHAVSRNREYPGLNGPPLTWKQVLHKFEQLSSGRVEVEQCRNLAEAVRNLESISVSDLTGLLVTVGSADASPTRDVASRTKHDGRQ